jgi:flagellar protein FlaJ
MTENVELFLSKALAIGVAAGFVLTIIGLVSGVLFVQLFITPDTTLIGIPVPDSVSRIISILKIPALILLSGAVFGTIGFGLGFGSYVTIPRFQASSRERKINILLADGIAFMYALSLGGLNQLETIRAVAEADDTYGEVSKEFQSIVLETEFFDTDYRTAIQKQALQTPSDELSQFLVDMLSIINSGGDMTAFLEEQKDKHIRTAKQAQKEHLDTLELFGEMYMTLSLFPLFLIIIMVVMSMLGSSKTQLLVATVYGLIPLIGAGFLVMISTVMQDNINDGYLRDPNDDQETDRPDSEGIFAQISRRERLHTILTALRKPHVYFRDNPLHVLLVTVPTTLVVLLTAFLTGNAPLSVDAMKTDPIYGTFIWLYVPLYVNFVPLGVFYEWNVRSRHAILTDLSENLRKLASANDTGMTLLESFGVVSDTSSGLLSDEFGELRTKVAYGTRLKTALREFNNKYHIPRLARMVKLISEAQEASSQISDVLSTAARMSENQDDIDSERVTRTRMQMIIIIMTYMTLLAIMALLKLRFLDVMIGLTEQASGASGGSTPDAAGGQFSSSIDGELLSLLFFHAVVLQSITSSFISGYIRDVKLISGVKYAVVLSTIALVVWVGVTIMAG